jgi:exonuclease III
MSSLKLCSFNIQGGIERKFQFDDVCSMVKQYDIVCIQETWLIDSCQFNVRGYGIFRSDRGSHKKKNTGSGGVVVLYKLGLKKGLKKLSSANKDFLWLRLDKNFFNVQNDIYIANCYIAPEDSVVHKNIGYDVMDILSTEIAYYSQKGDVILTGDLNARTGNIQEKLVEFRENFQYENEIDNIGVQSSIVLPKRTNSDKVINQFGRKLMEINETFHLAILNGRILGDTGGEKTCYTNRGSSTVDYFIVCTDLIKSVMYMKVKPQTWFSDHSPIEICLKTGNRNRNNTILDEISKAECRKSIRYVWDEPGINRYRSYMNCDQTKILFRDVENCNSVEETLQKLQHIIRKVTRCSLTYKMVKPGSEGSRKSQVYDNKDIKDAKKSFNSSWQLYREDRANQNRYRAFIASRSKYKRIKYLYFRYRKEDKLVKLANIESKNPKLFWKTVRSFNNKNKETPNITSEDWVAHFKQLLNAQGNTTNKSFLDYIKYSLPVMEKDMSQGLMDHEITEKELENAIKGLKNGKAVGPDKISNEMIKYGDKQLHNALKLLFNRIIKSATYPEKWKYSLITPLHKSGDIHNPSNYRGIAVADCIGKLLNSIINDRIYKFMESNGLWAPNQNGFMKNRRTEDNVFILHTLFQKYVRTKRRQLYVAFIDFSKYFDTINRDMLMYKLLKYNITGNIYKVIKKAYEDSFYSVKTMHGNTAYFNSKNGVKQGCNLSPTLSNIYQNDLHEIFDSNCSPVAINGFSLNSLSWADDLVLFSQSMEGLQNCMNKLQEYCNKWGLTINVEKSKFMIMSLGSIRKKRYLMYNGEYMEQVNTYKYLGLLLSSNGKFKNTILDRHNKAQKAYYQVKGSLSTTSNVSRSLALCIFDKQIAPILLYGSCIWGQVENFGTINVKIDAQPGSVMNKSTIAKMCNDILKKEVPFDVVRYDKENNQAIIRVKNYFDKLCLISEGQTHDKVNIEHYVTNIKHTCEKLHTKFCKFVLGMSKFSSDFAVLGELGRVPLTHKILVSHVLYWLNLEHGTSNWLLNCAYQECKTGSHDFIESIKQILYSCGMGYMVNDNNVSKNMLKTVLYQRLKDQYVQEYCSKVHDSEIFNDL